MKRKTKRLSQNEKAQIDTPRQPYAVNNLARILKMRRHSQIENHTSRLYSFIFRYNVAREIPRSWAASFLVLRLSTACTI